MSSDFRAGPDYTPTRPRNRWEGGLPPGVVAGPEIKGDEAKIVIKSYRCNGHSGILVILKVYWLSA